MQLRAVKLSGVCFFVGLICFSNGSSTRRFDWNGRGGERR